MLGAAILALLLQVAELWLPSRIASAHDVAWNFAGAGGGAVLASVVLAAALAFLWHGACATLLVERLARTRKPWLIVPLGTFAATTLGLMLMHAGITSESIRDITRSNNLNWFVTQRDILGRKVA